MSMKPLFNMVPRVEFNMARVEHATDFIAAELRTLLDKKYGSHTGRQLRKAGLTNGEGRLAILLALSAVQNEAARDVGSLERDEDDDEVAA